MVFNVSPPCYLSAYFINAINNYGLKHCMSIKGHACCLGQDLVKRSKIHFDLMDHINCSHLM